MLLSIIIPEYKQDRLLLMRAINSIYTQKNVNFDDFEVVVVQDGGDDIDYHMFKFNGMNVRWLKPTERLGCGLARQYAIDNSTSDWIYFYDSDDEFFTSVSLWYILKTIKNNQDKKIISFKFFNEISGVVSGHDMTSLYSIAISRSQINYLGIKFLQMNIYEDVAFVSTAFYCTPKENVIEAFDFPVYLYHENQNSITHGTVDFLYNLRSDIKAIKYVESKLNEFNRRDDFYYVYAGLRLLTEYDALKINGGSLNTDDVLDLNTYFSLAVKQIQKIGVENTVNIINAFKRNWTYQEILDRFNTRLSE